MKKLLTISAAFALLALITANLLAGTVVLKNGNSISGHIEEDGKRYVTVRMKEGTVQIYKSFVKEVIKDEEEVDVQKAPESVDLGDLEAAKIDLSKFQRPAVEKVLPSVDKRVEVRALNVSILTIKGWSSAELPDGIFHMMGTKDPKTAFQPKGTLAKAATFVDDKDLQIKISNHLIKTKMSSWNQDADPVFVYDETDPENKVLEYALVSGRFSTALKKEILTRHYYVWVGDATYIFSFTCPSAQIKEYEPIFEQVVKSLKING